MVRLACSCLTQSKYFKIDSIRFQNCTEGEPTTFLVWFVVFPFNSIILSFLYDLQPSTSFQSFELAFICKFKSSDIKCVFSRNCLTFYYSQSFMVCSGNLRAPDWVQRALIAEVLKYLVFYYFRGLPCFNVLRTSLPEALTREVRQGGIP